MKFTANLLSVAAAILLIPASALGVLRDSDFERARRDAVHHAQVQISKIAVPAVTPGECRVWGEVVRVFRGSTRFFGLGAQIEFDVSCKRRNDLIPSGDTLWLEVTALQDARFIETYLNNYRVGNGFEYRIPSWQYRLIESPTSAPACPDTLKGARCSAFEVPDIDVEGIARSIGTEATVVRVQIPSHILTRLRVVAAQRSRRNQFDKVSIEEVIADLVTRQIDDLEADVR